ncbi:MAG: hypothetical protein E3J72_19750 [Planctomycetota bacterium]|nr:MAG: hypothetical protein E3J72_19750 [Planctomycetota bacterium]
MQSRRKTFFLLIAAFCAGCSSPVFLTDDEHVRLTRVTLSSAPAYEKTLQLFVIPDSAANGTSEFTDPRGTHFAVNLADWSEILAGRLSEELEYRGALITEAAPNRVQFRITGVKSVFSGLRVEVSAIASLSLAGKTWTREYVGSDKVAYSAVLAFQGAVENLLKKILKDRDFLRVIEKD